MQTLFTHEKGPLPTLSLAHTCSFRPYRVFAPSASQALGTQQAVDSNVPRIRETVRLTS